MSTQRWYSRLWGTLYEPRTITALMVSVYTLLVLNGVAVIFDRPPHEWYYLVSALFMVIGGSTGAPAAWRGARWLEAPMAALACAGLVGAAIMDIARQLYNDTMAIKPPILVVMLALFFAMRALRIWPDIYAPDKSPITSERVAQAKAALAIKAEQEATEGHG